MVEKLFVHTDILSLVLCPMHVKVVTHPILQCTLVLKPVNIGEFTTTVYNIITV